MNFTNFHDETRTYLINTGNSLQFMQKLNIQYFKFTNKYTYTFSYDL